MPVCVLSGYCIGIAQISNIPIIAETFTGGLLCSWKQLNDPYFLKSYFQKSKLTSKILKN